MLRSNNFKNYYVALRNLRARQQFLQITKPLFFVNWEKQRKQFELRFVNPAFSPLKEYRNLTAFLLLCS